MARCEDFAGDSNVTCRKNHQSGFLRVENGLVPILRNQACSQVESVLDGTHVIVTSGTFLFSLAKESRR